MAVVETRCYHRGSDRGTGFDDSVHVGARLRGVGHGADLVG